MRRRIMMGNSEDLILDVTSGITRLDADANFLFIFVKTESSWNIGFYIYSLGTEYFSELNTSTLQSLGIVIYQESEGYEINIDTIKVMGELEIWFYPPGSSVSEDHKYLYVDTTDAPQYCYIGNYLNEEGQKYQIFSSGTIESFSVKEGGGSCHSIILYSVNPINSVYHGKA